MEPVGALGDIFRARASRWRNLAAGGIVSSQRPGCGSYRLIARGNRVKTSIYFLRRKGMVACACSRVRLIGAWRPLALAGGVTTAVCGSANSLKTFSKKCLTEIAVLLV